ncbi:MAG: GGDEF domain-containing protein [Candidatus Acidiferrales bacterium]
MAAHNSHSIFDISGDFIGAMPDLPKTRALAAKKRKNPADRDLEGSLVSALTAGDKELDHVLREVESISRALKSGKPGEIDRRIASHPAVWCAVKQMLVERELRYLALSDDLTCLYNRRGFYAAAAHQLKVARRNQKAAVLLFCDVDGLKAINDTFGHREGDHALVRTADALEEVFRDSDVLARLGGDEFAVLATELSPEHHHTILSRLYRSVKKAGKDEVRYELSLSVGAAWFNPQDPAPLGELMERADCAMYEVKRKRRFSPLSDAVLPRAGDGGGRANAFTVVKGKN